ncbi:MAG: multidrug efflux protein [Candidatus Marinimicrobia bacterium]|nr:multidrug efflux protein [Candidatus Neomarinimicrobiota bacterium]
MRNFTDIFVQRPVLAAVISLLILVLGIRSYVELPVREFPLTTNAVVTVNTTYYGADPDLIAGFITAPLEQAIAQADGIDYLTSSSRAGLSSISANLDLNHDPNAALNEINTLVNSVLNQLPPQAQRPIIRVTGGQLFAPVYIGLWSDKLPLNQITDYVRRVIEPQFLAIRGVQNVSLQGGQNLALRAWLDPNKLAAYNLTAADISVALAANNYLSGLGKTKGQMVQANLNATTGVSSLKDFENLAIKKTKGAIVRLKDVAKVEIGADEYESLILVDGKKSMWIAIETAPGSNLLEIVREVRKIIPSIKSQIPPNIEFKQIYDAGLFVESSISEVITTIVEALLIVTLVVFAFLGSIRSVVIPIIAIPLSLIGTFGMMLLFGFTINLLTLLAFVLAVGLVVDDAIIVVENVNRHMAQGMKSLQAAKLAARELGMPIIAMTSVLISVYIPIGFQGGLTGAMFTEFAFTLVGAVVISAIVALTLSPVMCSKMLTTHAEASGLESRIIHFVDIQMGRISELFRRALHDSLNFTSVTLLFASIVLGSIYFLYTDSRSELAPTEDKGLVNAMMFYAPNATIDQRLLYIRQLAEMTKDYPAKTHMFQNIGYGNINITAITLMPWEERDETVWDIQGMLSRDLSKIAGAGGAAFLQPALPAVGGAGSFGAPVQFVLGSTENFQRMNEVVENFTSEARSSGLFSYIDHDLKIDQPRSTFAIDRDKAAQLGLNMSDIGGALSAMLGGGYVNYFALEGRSYKVIPQVEQQYRLNADQLLNYHIRTPDDGTVPLSTIAKFTTKAVPQSFGHFQQMNAVVVSGNLATDVYLGDALTYLQDLAARTLPTGYTTDYAGESRRFMQESSGFVTTFIFALVIISLVLAALFESFRDPFIILVSVPMSIAGALLFINLGVGGASINIYTQVGLVTLMGLISKHGILIVQFANQLQSTGYSKREAIEKATEIRLRPILMTTGAMVFGVSPLLLADGAGAEARFNIGLVISSGVAIGTLFTLFVVPAVYLVLAADHSADGSEGSIIPSKLKLQNRLD